MARTDWPGPTQPPWPLGKMSAVVERAVEEGMLTSPSMTVHMKTR
jgi:hypothetical protein